MKRILVLALFAAVLMLPNLARAQQPPFIQLGGGTHTSPACNGAPQFGGMQWCFDSPLNSTKNIYYWSGTAWTILPGSGFNPAAPGPIGGTTPSTGTFTTLQANTSVGIGVLNTTEGTLTLNGGTSGAITIEGLTSGAGTYNLILPTSAGAIGALLTSGGGSSQQVWLADGATGTILTGAGATTIPAFSATPTISGTLIDQSSIQVSAAGTDIALATTNGGHFNSQLGTGTIPTCGTGTVSAISTDNAFKVTGATSPATVTFHTAFGAEPVCTCNDLTSALGACKAVPNSNGATVVITTTGTDSFEAVCIGH